MSYVLLWRLHVLAVSVSIALFLLRNLLNATGVAWRRWRLLRIGPHVVDSLLLASAIGLCVVLQQSPLHDAWLGAKLAALLVYIVAGALAINYGRTRAQRAGAFAVALASLAYIIGVALRKNAWSWLA